MNRYKTPLRYPGGKQKLAPFVAEVMAENQLEGGHYAEPYAGGAGVAIELLLNGTASHIHLNDSCSAVHSFWKSAVTDTEELCRRISRASLNVREWRKQQEILRRREEHSALEVGFSMFYLNRVNRSGILSGGLIGGLAQEGEWLMDARFPRAELIRRIENIARHKKNIHLRNWDAERFITTYLPRLPKESLVYCDPPYFDKADRLYLNHYQPEDHKRIAKVIQKIRLPWMVSYDAAPEILKYYSRRRAFIYGLQYNAQKAYVGTEAFFFSDRLTVGSASVVKSIDVALGSGRLRLAGDTLKMLAA
ncbi:DNA adenine methylase [Pseudoxanthomonas mexicana]|uniref:DNA adenine methylase n=1 Tax=Pseudoxanthomonas mexicana TaxID=128785 RepID=UPI001FD68248|nr:DNA adenine methylase [Pseudoxanthomonas mexicana]UOV04249.1 DNA adenine methylase [Pseudoxanthomonas mexicana]